MDIKRTKQQASFMEATADEVLFGGAAGGGKSYGQLIDALIFALRYPGSKQLILRRTYPELERSLIQVHLGLFPREVYGYNSSAHRGRFKNGSTVEFGFCDASKDVYKYQSAEYDIIRFDELTHFSEDMYIYLISRVRGANGYPKQVKSTTNPGGVGHYWVKERFIDPAPPNEVYDSGTGTRLFIPAKVQDNAFLMESDPEYIKRLENLSEKDKKALLYGEWDIFEGQYFTEWDAAKHVKSAVLSDSWYRYVTMDYGLDMLACYWIAVDEAGHAYVYKELYQSGLIVSDAAQKIKELTTEAVQAYYAPPDLWNRHSDTGQSTAEIFAEHGVPLVRASNNRVQGWLAVREWLKPIKDEYGNSTPSLTIDPCCRNLIRTLPAIQYDEKNSNDTANEPHELTHAPDAVRYFCAGRPRPTEVQMQRDDEQPMEDEQISSFISFGY